MAGGAVLVPSGGKGTSWKQKLPPWNAIYPFALVTSLFFLWGFAYGLLDVLNTHLQNTLGVTKLQSTGLQVAYFRAGYFAFSPIASEVLRRRGYKFTIIMGLTFACTAVIACGLASLETAANSYITCLPGTEAPGAAFHLLLSQSFNGIAAFAGPFMASKYFFSGDNASNLTNVQWVYLAVALMGAFIAILFVFYELPETSEAELEEKVQAAAELTGLTPRQTNLSTRYVRDLPGRL
ncbi:hypothetical protein FRC06_004891 [Ceratobasidium sp. 370]|nr:hypothetical protein FRC06_004891 [Ceratobasidium sp. 370]